MRRACGGYAGIFHAERRVSAEEWSEHYQRRETAEGKAVGRDSHKGIMILASAMRHSVGRPAMSMEGGTNL